MNPSVKPIKVYINRATWALGRCWPERRIITIAARGKDKLHTLAHELAHLRVGSHGPKHAALTEKLFEWLKQNV